MICLRLSRQEATHPHEDGRKLSMASLPMRRVFQQNGRGIRYRYMGISDHAPALHQFGTQVTLL
jgi:hypothetical protein